MSKQYRQMRSVPDKMLGQILHNHQQAAQYAVARVVAYDRYRWVRRAWYVATSAGLGWLLAQAAGYVGR